MNITGSCFLWRTIVSSMHISWYDTVIFNIGRSSNFLCHSKRLKKYNWWSITFMLNVNPNMSCYKSIRPEKKKGKSGSSLQGNFGFWLKNKEIYKGNMLFGREIWWNWREILTCLQGNKHFLQACKSITINKVRVGTEHYTNSIQHSSNLKK